MRVARQKGRVFPALVHARVERATGQSDLTRNAEQIAKQGKAAFLHLQSAWYRNAAPRMASASSKVTIRSFHRGNWKVLRTGLSAKCAPALVAGAASFLAIPRVSGFDTLLVTHLGSELRKFPYVESFSVTMTY